MDEAQEFLRWFETTWLDAELALHRGDAGPRLDTWSAREPVTLFGAWFDATSAGQAREAFGRLEASFADDHGVQERVDLVAHGVSGDLAYTVHREHTSTTVDGEPRDYELRVTQVYRREHGSWRVVHRHADPALRPDTGPGTGGVELREIDDVVRAELLAAVQLPPEQEAYVGSLQSALDDAAAYPEANPWPRGVYVDGVPVGFTMISWDLRPDPPDPTLVGPWFLWKLMIAPAHQGRGYGRAVVAAIADVIRPHGATELLTSYGEGEGDPSGFYASIGFVPTGERHEGEVLAVLALEPSH